MYDKEDLGLILLSLLPSAYISFKDSFLSSRNTLTIYEIYDTLFSYEKINQLVLGSIAQANGFVVRASYVKVRSKINYSNKICNYCKNKGTSNLTAISCRIRRKGCCKSEGKITRKFK